MRATFDAAGTGSLQPSWTNRRPTSRSTSKCTLTRGFGVRGANPSSQSVPQVAIWWHVRQHYRSIVDADLILAPAEVTADRLAQNDVNLLLGWDAVSAHLEEHSPESEGDDQGDRNLREGHGVVMRQLLLAPSSRVWPPAPLQELCNNKGAYLRLAEARGVAVAPTEVFNCTGATAQRFARFAVASAERRGWSRFVAKPSPSSWSRGVEVFDADAVNLAELLVAYFGRVRGALHVVLQLHLSGLEAMPETRCFFFGSTFLYAVANSRHAQGLPEILDHPEASSTAPTDSPRHLPPDFWRPHKRLGERVVRDVLPALKAFDGRHVDGFPWVVRLDLGIHPAADLVNANDNDGDVVFLNEIEIVPTLYLDAKFGHEHDFIAEYAAKFVKSAALAAGIDCPELDDPARAAPAAARGSDDGQRRGSMAPRFKKK